MKLLMLFFLPFVVFPVIYYKLATRVWLIENIGEKIILAIVIFVSSLVSLELSEGLVTLVGYLVWSTELSDSVFWILVGGTYFVICWTAISFLAGKIFKKIASPSDDSIKAENN